MEVGDDDDDDDDDDDNDDDDDVGDGDEWENLYYVNYDYKPCHR